jgi:AraC-like DNA-binding protein/lipopolysaccharide biosynthesis regulator YciM
MIVCIFVLMAFYDKIKKVTLSIIIIVITALSLKGQSRDVMNAINTKFACYLQEDNNGEVLKNLAAFYLSTEEFQKVISYAVQLKTLGDKNNNMRHRAYANTYLGQAYLMTNQIDAAKMYLNQALRQATLINNDSILSSVYNGLGLYASNVDSDYNGAVKYFFKGVESAKRADFKRLYHILLCNISGVYYLKGSPEGLKYSQECYDYGHSASDPFLILWGAVNSARMYVIVKKYDEALKYIKEAEFILQRNGYSDQTNIYNVYGEILVEIGDVKQAEKYFREALKNIFTAQISSKANLYLNLGKLLINQKRYYEAVPLLEEGIEISIEGHNNIFIKQLYESLSFCYSGMNNFEKSLKYFVKYHEEATRFFNEESERSINELRIQFDTERKENEAKQTKLELINRTRKQQYLIIFLLLAVIVSIYLYILYLHKNRLYRRIILSNKEYIKREDELRDQLRCIKTKCPEADKYCVSSLKEDKMEDIYRRTESVMTDESLYRDPDLTKEKIADKLNTNRTYLSQVINEKTGMSVPQYINSYRIKEAIRILSDTSDNTPLKAIMIDLGFNSMSTFYKLFQTSVGMTPTLYRKKVREFSS